jgi:hypothetical protein
MLGILSNASVLSKYSSADPSIQITTTGFAAGVYFFPFAENDFVDMLILSGLLFIKSTLCLQIIYKNLFDHPDDPVDIVGAELLRL